METKNMNKKWNEKKMVYLQARGLLLTRRSERRYAERRDDGIKLLKRANIEVVYIETID